MRIRSVILAAVLRIYQGNYRRTIRFRTVLLGMVVYGYLGGMLSSVITKVPGQFWIAGHDATEWVCMAGFASFGASLAFVNFGLTWLHQQLREGDDPEE